jgi:hypothetical protein
MFTVNISDPVTRVPEMWTTLSLSDHIQIHFFHFTVILSLVYFANMLFFLKLKYSLLLNLILKVVYLNQQTSGLNPEAHFSRVRVRELSPLELCIRPSI